MTAQQLAPFCSFLSACTWAIGISTYSALSRVYSASAINFSRALVALPIFFAVIVLATPGVSAFHAVSPVHVGWLMMSIVASYAFGDVVLLKSIHAIGLPSALAIASSYPLWSAIAGWAFRGELLSGQRVAGLCVVVAGTVLVILSGRHGSGFAGAPPSTASASRRRFMGVALAVVTSLLWAMNTYALAEGGSGISPFVANSIRMMIALVLCPAFGRLLSPGGAFWVSGKDLTRASWVFAVEGFGGSTLFLFGLTHAPIAIASALSSLAPVLTVPIAIALGWEKFSLLRSAGVLLVVVGLTCLF